MLGEPVGGRVRELGDDLDVAGHLERGEVLARERVERSEVGRPAGRGDDERLHVFFRQVRRHADHRRLGDVGMTLERGLDLGRRQVLAAAADHFLLAADERVRLVVVDAHEVAGPQPAVDDHGRGLLGHLVVAAHDRRVAQLELADLPHADDPAVVDCARVVDVAEHRMLACASRACRRGARRAARSSAYGDSDSA